MSLTGSALNPNLQSSLDLYIVNPQSKPITKEAKECSLGRISSMLILPFPWIVTFFQNLCYRFVDPNWRAFVVKGQGHFIGAKHHIHFNIAVDKANQIFSSIIASSACPKAWHNLYQSGNGIQKTESAWQKFSTGTCLGNCTTLAAYILKSGKVLTVAELQDIEKTDDFASTAQAVQLVVNSAIEFNKTILEMPLLGPNIEFDKQLEIELKKIGESLKTYRKYDKNKQTRIRYLLTSGIQVESLDKTTIKSLLDCDNFFSFGFTFNKLKNQAKEMHLIKPGLEFIKEFYLLPLKAKSEVVAFTVAQTNLLTHPMWGQHSIDEKAVMLIAGKDQKHNNGHAMLLEIDHANKQYVFYDNNRGYYRWDNFQTCLSELEKRLKKEDYNSAEVLLIPICTQLT